jgi:hypothetical protein
MAGDWIKMRHDLVDDPAVVLIASRTNMDEYGVVGRLQKLWSWADRHTITGNAMSVTRVWIDRYISAPGFADAMVEAGWLDGEDGSIDIPDFTVHNGESAKKRAQTNKRVAVSREKQRDSNAECNANGNAPSVTKSVTREEKRREDINTPIPPEGGTPPIEIKKERKKREGEPLQAYLDRCKAESVKPIPADDPIFEYVREVGLTDEMLVLAWFVFKTRHLDKKKLQKDWLAHYRNAVKSNWFKLWFLGNDGAAGLTTAGVQAQREMEAKNRKAA